MKVKDVRLHLIVNPYSLRVEICDQGGRKVCQIDWGTSLYTKPQAIALAKRLCDRFNKGQEGK